MGDASPGPIRGCGARSRSVVDEPGRRLAEGRNYAPTVRAVLRPAGFAGVLIAFHKPYGVLSQFTTDDGKPTLADYIEVPGVYAAGRLDHDSEGLLLLTDDGTLQHAIGDPSRQLAKRYLAQVEGVPGRRDLERFEAGLVIGVGVGRFQARPAKAVAIDPPAVADRVPPIRHRTAIPTAWIAVELHEGRNRQVRRMTAAIGHPTLRLIRVGIGAIDLFDLGLDPGAWKPVDPAKLASARSSPETRQTVSGPAASSLSTGFRNRRYWE